jgi:hypothetical protein
MNCLNNFTRSVFFLPFIIVLLSACSSSTSEPDLSSPNVYQHDNVTFSYPGNWKITEEDTEEDEGVEYHSIIIDSSHDGVYMLQFTQPEIDLALEQYADDYISDLLGDVEESSMQLVQGEANEEAEPIQAQILGEVREGLSRKFSVSILGEKIPYHATFYKFNHQRHSIFLLNSVPAEEWEMTKAGVEFIYKTLKME